MWQRAQTIFLLIVVISMAAMIFLPIWISGDTETVFYPFYLKTADADIYLPYTSLAILAIATITVGIIEIGKYNNRLLQIKLGAFNSLLMAANMVLAILLTRDLQAEFGGGFGISIFLPAAGMVSNAVANRFIRRDEKIVKESERLR